jgi:hypothetical protein
MRSATGRFVLWPLPRSRLISVVSRLIPFCHGINAAAIGLRYCVA